MRARVAIAAAIVITTAAVSGCSTTTPTASAAAATAAPTTAAAATLDGIVVLPIPDFEDTYANTSTAVADMRPGDDCTGAGNYQEVATGLSVAVTGSAGQQLATTTLYPGTVANYPDDTGIAACEFTISASVAPDAGTYTITVGSFGKQTLTLSQLGSVAVLLGQ